MTGRWPRRMLALAVVAGAATVALAAIGDGSVTAVPAVTVVQIPSGTGVGTASVQNTTASTTFSVRVGSDATCDPSIGFNVTGGNPFFLAPGTMKPVTISCPASVTSGMRRCLYHATDETNGTPLADFQGVCSYASMPSLAPQATTVDFGMVAVGDSSTMSLTLHNNGATTIKRIYLQTTDLDGNFQFSTPCNPDGPFCDATIAPVTQGNDTTIQIKCTPVTASAHSAQVYVTTDTFQYLATGVTLQCTGTGAGGPVLGANPASLDIVAGVEVTSGSATAVVHLTNTGTGTLLVNDVRTVDVDTGAAADWTYSATGKCVGGIPPACMLGNGDQVDVNLTFDPSSIGTRRATLLVSYHDTLDRTKSIPLDATGLGATLDLVGNQTTLDFGVVQVAHPSTIDFALANRGNRSTTAMLSMTAGATPPFSLSPATMATVTPTAVKTITATCNPTTAGMFATTITAQGSDTFDSPPVALAAQCEGSTLMLYTAPTSLQFGQIRIGEPAPLRTIQLQTTGGALTLPDPPHLDMPNSNVTVGSLSGTTVTSGTPVTFDVTIEPQAEGDISNHVVITDGAGETIKLPVSGKIVKASFLVPAVVDVGTFCVNQPTTSSSVSLVSTGTATITVQAPALQQTASAFDLTFTAPTMYPTALPTGDPAVVAVTPQRQPVATTISDAVEWTTDVAGMTTATTQLSAGFVDSGGAIAPPALDFGRVKAHLFGDDGQRVMIQNCNDTPLELDSPTIGAPFSIDSPNFPSVLNPNETTTFSVGFHPTRIGVFTDTLTIRSPQLPDAPLQVALVGEGITDPMPGSDAGPGSGGLTHTSFYACSCASAGSGGAGGGGPIVLAIMCVLFPRRRRA